MVSLLGGKHAMMEITLPAMDAAARVALMSSTNALDPDNLVIVISFIGFTVLTFLGKCGDGVIDPVDDETCDDANEVSYDGCTNCRVELGWNCELPGKPCQGIFSTFLFHPAFSPSRFSHFFFPHFGFPLFLRLFLILAEICGDGQIVGNEKCDDGNTSDDDGCSGTCDFVDAGYVCSGPPGSLCCRGNQ
jgi:cysteine-rich repeat protein